jgi:putative FmdB family regulatory protein
MYELRGTEASNGGLGRMPIYEYACDTCQSTFERKQKFSDDPVRECPECGSSVRRVLYPAGIIFKGSGFYVTDNRGSNGATSMSSSSNGDHSSKESKSVSGTAEAAKSDTASAPASKAASAAAADS